MFIFIYIFVWVKTQKRSLKTIHTYTAMRPTPKRKRSHMQRLLVCDCLLICARLFKRLHWFDAYTHSTAYAWVCLCVAMESEASVCECDVRIRLIRISLFRKRKKLAHNLFIPTFDPNYWCKTETKIWFSCSFSQQATHLNDTYKLVMNLLSEKEKSNFSPETEGVERQQRRRRHRWQRLIFSCRFFLLFLI